MTETKQIVGVVLPNSAFNKKDLNELGMLQDDADLISAAHKNERIEMLKSGTEYHNGEPVDPAISWQIIASIYNVVEYRCGIICAYIYK